MSGDPRLVTPWVDERKGYGWRTSVAIIIGGCGVYGASLGIWHGERQAFFVAINLPCK